MAGPVQYDFDAAADLSAALVQLNRRLADLGTMRARLRSAHLSGWTGRRSADFAQDHARRQSALAALAERALQARARVDGATASANELGGLAGDAPGDAGRVAGQAPRGPLRAS